MLFQDQLTYWVYQGGVKWELFQYDQNHFQDFFSFWITVNKLRPKEVHLGWRCKQDFTQGHSIFQYFASVHKMWHLTLAGLLLYNKMCRVKTSKASADIHKVNLSFQNGHKWLLFHWWCAVAPSGMCSFQMNTIVTLGCSPAHVCFVVLICDSNGTSGSRISSGFSGVLLPSSICSALLWQPCKLLLLLTPFHPHQSYVNVSGLE
jgi:hypothetical protein